DEGGTDEPAPSPLRAGGPAAARAELVRRRSRDPPAPPGGVDLAGPSRGPRRHAHRGVRGAGGGGGTGGGPGRRAASRRRCSTGPLIRFPIRDETTARGHLSRAVDVSEPRLLPSLIDP